MAVLLADAGWVAAKFDKATGLNWRVGTIGDKILSIPEPARLGFKPRNIVLYIEKTKDFILAIKAPDLPNTATPVEIKELATKTKGSLKKIPVSWLTQ